MLLRDDPQPEKAKTLLSARAKFTRSLVQSSLSILVLIRKGFITIRRHLAPEPN